MTRSTDPKSVVHMVQVGVHWVPRSLSEELRRQVELAIPWLPHGVPCRIEHLVTPQFWLPLSNSERRLMGRCLAHWVANDELELVFLGRREVGHKSYGRK